WMEMCLSPLVDLIALLISVRLSVLPYVPSRSRGSRSCRPGRRSDTAWSSRRGRCATGTSHTTHKGRASSRSPRTTAPARGSFLLVRLLSNVVRQAYGNAPAELLDLAIEPAGDNQRLVVAQLDVDHQAISSTKPFSRACSLVSQTS